ncbi:hypothetical protein PPERSA_01055 [Pseudocohnilembus persalinus]|uniref:DOMON domain-containing protein n=1 Tax=Pseudocohnilembus persalinus TaxID=266149 RepID=A0A0V0QUD7_PSEPJ|nr:hypothetical protein PPERSA_01055 [Pseudocohnilembus persalinus]|eukprot:KRX05977.1 hypothetical protein PPERSA_01055 [Pseudocohnilembus persalinus]
MNSEVKIFSEVGMILKWGFSENDKVDFYMEIKQSSWMSIGIGSSMKEADVFYTEIDGPNLKLIDGSLHGYHDPKIDNQNDLIILGYRVSNSITSVKFQRAFDTGDSNDKVLLKDNDYTFIAAYTNSDSVQEHSGSQAVESHETSIKYFVKNNNHNKELENLISQGFSYKQVQAKLNEEIKYCIFGNKIISLQNIFHPGGNYIFNKIYGREIDRFFFGGYALEGDNRRSHQHTPKAELFTLKNVVGELKLPESHLILKHTNKKQKIDCTYYNAWHISQLKQKIKYDYIINQEI